MVFLYNHWNRCSCAFLRLKLCLGARSLSPSLTAGGHQESLGLSCPPVPHHSTSYTRNDVAHTLPPWGACPCVCTASLRRGGLPCPGPPNHRRRVRRAASTPCVRLHLCTRCVLTHAPPPHHPPCPALHPLLWRTTPRSTWYPPRGLVDALVARGELHISTTK